MNTEFNDFFNQLDLKNATVKSANQALDHCTDIANDQLGSNYTTALVNICKEFEIDLISKFYTDNYSAPEIKRLKQLKQEGYHYAGATTCQPASVKTIQKILSKYRDRVQELGSEF